MTCQKYPVCTVQINNDKVLFSFGKPGTRDRLFARVCRYTKDERCINKAKDYPNLSPRKIDFYWEIPPLGS